MKQKVNVFWFRRDLRVEDNIGFSACLSKGLPCIPIFIFDDEEFEKLKTANKRLKFIQNTLETLKNKLLGLGLELCIEYAQPISIIKKLSKDFEIVSVFANEEYESLSIKRDQHVQTYLASKAIPFHTFKDHVIWSPKEILKKDGTPYTVYTAYAKKWKALYEEKNSTTNFPIDESFPISSTLIENYESQRDFPGMETSKLGAHLRYGTLSIRKCVQYAYQTSPTWLNQLIWREFFIQILYHFPDVEQNSFKKAYDRIEWENNEIDFQNWCKGQTGFPLIDAGMKELINTGYMPNRVRMLAANFLCKILLIDWRWGEAFFAEHLLDYELASNNGNWQWSAGTGSDAAPYFRIFNPILQQKKFDKDAIYIKKWLPDYTESNMEELENYLKERREIALRTYKNALYDRL